MDEPVYTAREVARVLGIPDSRVHYWARTGLVSPSVKRDGRPFYRFSDLVAVKAAKELLDRGCTLQSVRKSLLALRAALPSLDRVLTRLRVVSDGKQLVVIGDDVSFEPLSGQVVMDFLVSSVASRLAEVAALPSPEEQSAHSAYGWFLDGCAKETAGDDQAAELAFRSALELDPALAAAHTNLGNLAFRRGQRDAARERYLRALELDADQPEARFNLGNLLDEAGDTERAVAEWTRVAALAPAFPDAHFNLGAALAKAGAADAARVHLRRYLAVELAGDGNRAYTDAARALLGTLGG